MAAPYVEQCGGQRGADEEVEPQAEAAWLNEKRISGNIPADLILKVTPPRSIYIIHASASAHLAVTGTIAISSSFAIGGWPLRKSSAKQSSSAAPSPTSGLKATFVAASWSQSNTLPDGG